MTAYRPDPAELDPVDQEIIDFSLQLMYSHIHRLVSQTCPSMFQPQTLEQLRSGPLGRDLARLGEIARGRVEAPKDEILTTVESVLQLLFWPAAADDYTVPRSFWHTDLGRVLAQAKYRAYAPSELVSIRTAATRLGVTRSTIFRWMDDRILNYVRDDLSGRTFVVRRDIDNLQQVSSLFVDD